MAGGGDDGKVACRQEDRRQRQQAHITPGHGHHALHHQHRAGQQPHRGGRGQRDQDRRQRRRQPARQQVAHRIQQRGQHRQPGVQVELPRLRLHHQQHAAKAQADGQPAAQVHRLAQHQPGQQRHQQRRRQVDGRHVGQRQVEQRRQVHEGGHALAAGACQHAAVPQAAHLAQHAHVPRHQQDQRDGDHPAHDDQLGRRHPRAHRLDQRVVAHEGGHRQHHPQDALAVQAVGVGHRPAVPASHRPPQWRPPAAPAPAGHGPGPGPRCCRSGATAACPPCAAAG